MCSNFVPGTFANSACHSCTAHQPIDIIQNITLDSYEAFSSFVRHVPKPYYHHIRSLSLCLKARSGSIDQTSTLIYILSLATRVESLSLHFIGSPAKSIIPTFKNLHDLRSLHVSNCGDENTQPLYAVFPFPITLTCGSDAFYDILGASVWSFLLLWQSHNSKN